MNLETFFEKFDLFADAPNAVSRMRVLVLELAVQGRLSGSFPGDDAVPPENEFREIAALLASSLGLRSTKESLEETQPPFDIPAHWRWLALADIGAAQTGTTPSKTDRDAFNGEIPFIKPADILPDSINYSNESLTRHGAESGSRLAPSGSLLMVCIGTIGKCNLINRECGFNQQINSLTPVAFVDPKYLLVAARSRFFQDAAWRKSSSTTIAILNKGKWLSIPVPIPPLAEQTRIVAKVDELMALCDRLEAQQQERETRHAALARASLARFADAPTPANLNFIFHKSYDIVPADLRKSILTLAVQGKLVPQDPNDEPVENTLRAVGQERTSLIREGLLKKSDQPQLPVDNSSDNCPDTWKVVPLAAMCISITDGDHLPPPKAEIGIPFLVISNVRWGGISFEGCRFVIEEYFEGLDWIRKPREGDILYTLVGSFGIPVIVDSGNPFCVQRHIGILRPSKHIDRNYLNYALASQFVFDQASGIATGIAQKTVPLAGLRRIKLPLPPLAEQRRIVAKVDELMALVDALENQLVAARNAAEKLMEAVVAELTSQPSTRSLLCPRQSLLPESM